VVKKLFTECHRNIFKNYPLLNIYRDTSLIVLKKESIFFMKKKSIISAPFFNVLSVIYHLNFSRKNSVTSLPIQVSSKCMSKKISVVGYDE
jgi:hypothetical protein